MSKKQVVSNEEVKQVESSDELVVTLLGTYSNKKDIFIVHEVQLNVNNGKIIAHHEHKCDDSLDMRDRLKILTVERGLLD